MLSMCLLFSIDIQVDVVNDEKVNYMFASRASTNINEDGFVQLDIPEQRLNAQDSSKLI